MHIIYNDTPAPDKQHDRHIENWYYLKWLLLHEDTSTLEKSQASKELDIAERKLSFWARQPGFSQAHANQTIERMKTQWGLNHRPR